MKRLILIAGSMLLLASLAAVAQDIKTDYDRSFKLSDLQSFHLATQQREPTEALAANPIVDKRIAEALRTTLIANGIQESSEPKFLVAYYASVKDRTQVTAYGWGRPYWGGGMATFEPTHYTEGTLIVDFVDTKSKALVWRGTITGTVEPNKSHDRLQKNVAKLINKFKKDVEKQQTGK